MPLSQQYALGDFYQLPYLQHLFVSMPLSQQYALGELE